MLHDVSLVTPFKTGSDHRPIIAKIVLNEKRKKKVLQLTWREQCVKVVDDAQLKEAIEKENWDQLNEIDEDYDSHIQMLKDFLRKAKVTSPR